MKRSDIPPNFNIPFAASAGGAFLTYPIPEASQIPITPGRASLTDGFVPLNMTEIAAGGVPPFGPDMNGILKQITEWARWQGAGATVQYDSAFATAIGGYPLGSIVLSTGAFRTLYMSLVDDNMTDPNTGSLSWLNLFAPVLKSGGYLTPSPAEAILTNDVVASTQVFWRELISGVLPCWNGFAFAPTYPIALTLNLVSAHLANTLYDVYSINDGAGNCILATGPAWSNSGAGTSIRGAAADVVPNGTLAFFVNGTTMTMRNGSSTFSVPAGEAFYLGTILIDGTAGQLTCTVSWGQSRKWGVWNAYNRRTVLTVAGDPTTSWNYAGSTIRPSNGNSANRIQLVSGFPFEQVEAVFQQNNVLPTGAAANIYVGWNSTTVVAGTGGITDNPINAQVAWVQTARYAAPPFLGVANVQALEQGNNSVAAIFRATQPYMRLSTNYMA